jgi:hypothetical protein
VDEKRQYDARILENIRVKEEVEVQKDKMIRDRVYIQKELND